MQIFVAVVGRLLAVRLLRFVVVAAVLPLVGAAQLVVVGTAVVAAAVFGRHTAVISAAYVEGCYSLEIQHLDYSFAVIYSHWENLEVLPVAGVAVAVAAALQNSVEAVLTLQIAALFVLVSYIASAFDRRRVLLVDNVAYHHELGRQRDPALQVVDCAMPL